MSITGIYVDKLLARPSLGVLRAGGHALRPGVVVRCVGARDDVAQRQISTRDEIPSKMRGHVTSVAVFRMTQDGLTTTGDHRQEMLSKRYIPTKEGKYHAC